MRMTKAAAAVVATLALAACGGKSTTTSTPNPAPGDKVLHLSFMDDPGQPPDPDVYYAGQGLLLTTNLYEGLLHYAPGTAEPKVAPLLATSWTAAKDSKTFTFQLRKDVVFHDGTPFTAAAVKPSFDRRLSVNQGPAYMVADVASVTTSGDYQVTITLKNPNPFFLDYLASPYGPRMMNPALLKANAGKDFGQTYLQTHDVGTGPFTLTDAKVGSHYAMAAFDKYWGTKSYFTTVDIPVETDMSTTELLLNKGQLAVILHELPQSAVRSYLNDKSLRSYSLPTMMSNFLYVNPALSFLKTAENRVALEKAIDIDQIFQQAYLGRGKKADQAYPAHMMAEGMATQSVAHDPSALQKLVTSLPADQKTITVGYDSQSVDNQLVANLISAQLAPYGLTVKVQSYPTSQIFGWVGNPKGAPELLLALGWPDAAPPYTWAHISFDPTGGLNYLHCSDPTITRMLTEGATTGSADTFSQIGVASVATGCWYNLVDQDDFMVAQPWLKGVEAAHVVAAPNTLSLNLLSVG
ncbi:MAG: peptide/nickel transport system substrate-binding protein [Micromonosporaceae bacterium]